MFRNEHFWILETEKLCREALEELKSVNAVQGFTRQRGVTDVTKFGSGSLGSVAGSSSYLLCDFGHHL